MWDTPMGPRRIVGAERLLLAAGTAGLYDWMDEMHDWSCDIPVVDNMDGVDRPYWLLLVAERLFNGLPAPKHFAWNEGLLAAIFEHIEGEVVCEIDSQREDPPQDGNNYVHWRTLVKNAWKETHNPQEFSDEEVFSGRDQALLSMDMDEWRDKIDGLAAQVLWDDDYLLQPDPALMKHLGISPDYYTRFRPRLTDRDYKELEALASFLDREVYRKMAS